MGFEGGSDAPREWPPPYEVPPYEVPPYQAEPAGIELPHYAEPRDIDITRPPRASGGWEGRYDAITATDTEPTAEGDIDDNALLSPFGHWERDDIKITILGDGAAKASSYAAVFGEVDHATFTNSFCVVIGDDGRLEYRAQHEYNSVTFDANIMRADMGLIAGWALQRLVDTPDSVVWNAVFRYTLGAAMEPQEFTATTSEGPMHVVTIDCDNVAVGDRASADISAHRHGGDARASLAVLVRSDAALARSLALALSDPVAAHTLRQDIESRAVSQAPDLPIETLVGAIEADGDNATVDITGTRLSTVGVMAVLVGSRTEATHTASLTIDEVAVTGLWPDTADTTGAPLPWQDYQWMLLDLEHHKRFR